MKYKLRRLTCLLLCLIVSFVAMAPPAAQAFVAEAAMVYKLAEVLLVGCGIYHVATSDASHALVEGLFNAYPTTKQMCDNYAQQVVGGKLWVTAKFLDDIKPFYQSVRDFFADGFASGGGSVAGPVDNPFSGHYSNISATISTESIFLFRFASAATESITLSKTDRDYKALVIGLDAKGYLQIVVDTASGSNYADTAADALNAQLERLKNIRAINNNIGCDRYVLAPGSRGLVVNGYRGSNLMYSRDFPYDVSYFVPIVGGAWSGSSTVPYTVDQTLTADDVIDGWSRDWPDGSVDPDQAKAPVINIPADAGALTGAKAGDVWPKQDAGEVVVPGSPTLGNVYDRLGTLNDIASGVKTGVDSLTGALEGVNVGVGTIAGIISAIKDFIDSIRQAIENFFDSPSDFDLNFDGFKSIILPDRFPFCIPFDFIKSIKVFAASARDFKFNIDLKTEYFEVHHEVDLTPFSIPIAFFRYVVVIWFVWILLTRTRDMMKW